MSIKKGAENGRQAVLRNPTFIVAYLSLLAFAFTFQSLPPILRHIVAEMKLSHARAGLLMGLFALPGIFLTIPGGWLADRLGIKRVGVGALLFMAFGVVLVVTADGFAALSLGRLVSGIGAMVLVVTAATLISSSFSGKKLGEAMGLYNTGMPVGTIICFTMLGPAAAVLGWRAAAAVPIAIALAALFFFQRYDDFPPTATERINLAASVKASGSAIWYAGFAWLWFNAAAIAFLTFAPEYFSDIGYSANSANLLTSFIMWGALIVSPLIGPLMTTLDRKVKLILAGSFLPALIYLAAPKLPALSFPLVALLGLTAALLPAPLFALPAQIVKREHQGLAFGILSTCLNMGILLGPYLVGLARDLSGSHSTGFLLMAAFSGLAGLAILPLQAGFGGSNNPLDTNERQIVS